MKIYMAGAGGMLGEAFFKEFNGDYEIKATDIDVNEDWLSYLDFRNLQEYIQDVTKFNPDYLFHIGAFTDLEYCENNIEETYRTNTMSVENAVYIAKSLNIPLLYIGTAGIFDGSKNNFDDWDLPNPMCTYARSKYAGEKFVIENMDRYLVCRAGWMMGGGPKKDKKFVNKIIKQVKDGKKVLNIVDDKDGTPTYTFDFANNVKLLLQNQLWGLYNMACDGQTSRVEVAAEIIRILGLENEIQLNKVSSDFFSKEYFAERPASERLINRKLNLRNLNIMRDWKIALKEYIDQNYKDYIL
jgi:dTDP-4-dehydrorhamnose reductase